jgi:hypothetical protein
MCRIQPPTGSDGRQPRTKTIKFGDKTDTLATKPVSKTFKPSKIANRVDRICDPAIRHRVRAFLAKHPDMDEGEWKSFCDEFAQIRKDASGKAGSGAPIRKVRVFDGVPKEYGMLKGAFYKDLKEHKGQFVYVLDDGTPDGEVALEPVYAFQSPAIIRAKVLDAPKLKRLVGFFQSGCTVEIEKTIDELDPPLEPGTAEMVSSSRRN